MSEMLRLVKKDSLAWAEDVPPAAAPPAPEDEAALGDGGGSDDPEGSSGGGVSDLRGEGVGVEREAVADSGR